MLSRILLLPLLLTACAVEPDPTPSADSPPPAVTVAPTWTPEPADAGTDAGARHKIPRSEGPHVHGRPRREQPRAPRK